MRCYISGFSRRNDWQTLAKNGGGVLNNTFPHFLDIVLQLTGGTVTDVFGDLQLIASGGDVLLLASLFAYTAFRIRVTGAASSVTIFMIIC